MVGTAEAASMTKLKQKADGNEVLVLITNPDATKEPPELHYRSVIDPMLDEMKVFPSAVVDFGTPCGPSYSPLTVTINYTCPHAVFMKLKMPANLFNFKTAEAWKLNFKLDCPSCGKCFLITIKNLSV